MTVSQIFECSIGRKTVWAKRGEEISKRSVMPVSTIQSRTKIEPKVNPKT